MAWASGVPLVRARTSGRHVSGDCGNQRWQCRECTRALFCYGRHALSRHSYAASQVVGVNRSRAEREEERERLSEFTGSRYPSPDGLERDASHPPRDSDGCTGSLRLTRYLLAASHGRATSERRIASSKDSSEPGERGRLAPSIDPHGA